MEVVALLVIRLLDHHGLRTLPLINEIVLSVQVAVLELLILVLDAGRHACLPLAIVPNLEFLEELVARHLPTVVRLELLVALDVVVDHVCIRRVEHAETGLDAAKLQPLLREGARKLRRL